MLAQDAVTYFVGAILSNFSNFVGAILSNFSNFMGANKQFSNFVGATTNNLPGVEIVGPAKGTTELMIWVGRLIVEVVGLTISFPVLKKN